MTLRDAQQARDPLEVRDGDVERSGGHARRIADR
jgi:hypothetical protein